MKENKMKPTTITAIHLPVETFRMLRAAAFARAQRDGGRPSVSALIVELVEDARARLEAEAALDSGEMVLQPTHRRRSLSPNMRWRIIEAASFKCAVCGASARDGAELHIDHIVPVSRGGVSDESNLQVLCKSCNIGKGNKMPRILDDDALPAANKSID